jgi:hypothetical protein
VEIIEAWRTSRGTRLVFLFPGPRKLLVPDEGLEAVSEDKLRQALETGAELTATEACFAAPDGSRWLAQATGPAWAGSEGSASLFGTLFSSLEGSGERFEVPGTPLRPKGPEGDRLAAELTLLWESGRAAALREPG